MIALLEWVTATSAMMSLGYLVLVNAYQTALLVGTAAELRTHGHVVWQERRWRLLSSPAAPRVSILAPAYNEEATIRQSVRALLTLGYPSSRSWSSTTAPRTARGRRCVTSPPLPHPQRLRYLGPGDGVGHESHDAGLAGLDAAAANGGNEFAGTVDSPMCWPWSRTWLSPADGLVASAWAHQLPPRGLMTETRWIAAASRPPSQAGDTAPTRGCAFASTGAFPVDVR